MESWELALQNYKTDPAAAAAELARAQKVYTDQTAAGNTAGADAAHTWANQIRQATGTSTSYNDVTGALLPGKTGIVPGQPVVVPTVPVPTVYNAPPVQPTVVQPYVQPAPAAPTGPTVAINQVAQTAYYQAANALANDSTMMTQFLKENPWANPDNNQWDQSTATAFSTWADNYVQGKSAEAQAAGIQFDATKEPWWPSYVDMMTARDDLTKQSLKTALDLKRNAIGQQSADVKANYDYQVAEIDNDLNLANWASGQELASSGVILVGMLSWALTANEAKGINEKALAGADRTNYLNKLANDITILTADYADSGTAIDKATITEIAAQRMLFLTGNKVEYDRTMALAATLKGQREALNISAPSTVKAGQAALATATKNQNMQTAAFLAGLVQQGIYLNQNNDGTYGYKTGLTADQQLNVNTQLFDQWYNTQGLNFNYAQLASNETQQKFENWATTQGLNLNISQQNWQQVVDTAGMSVNQQNVDIAQQGANLNQQQFDWAKSTDAASIYGQYGITFKTDTTGKITGMNRVPTPSEKLAIQNSAYDYWYKKQSVAQNWRQLTDAAKQNQFANWATTQGIAIDNASLSETIRSHKVTEGIDQQNANTSQQNANTAAAGGAGGTNAPVYDPSDDRALVGAANFIPSGAGSAPYLRLGAYSGAMTSTDAALKDFFYGGTTEVTPATTVGKVTTPAVTQAYTGLNAMNQTDAAAIVRLIPDDVRAGEVWAMYAAGHNLGTATATFNAYATQNKLTPAQIASGLGFLTQIRGGQ